MIKDGIHKLTGVDYIDVSVGWEDDPDVNGVLLCIDGQHWLAYEDPNDGYRSYGMFHQIDGAEIHNTFPPQKVLVSNLKWDYDDNGWPSSGHIVTMYNPYDHSEILRVGTDASDSYYPHAIFEWHPENLPINKQK